MSLPPIPPASSIAPASQDSTHTPPPPIDSPHKKAKPNQDDFAKAPGTPRTPSLSSGSKIFEAAFAAFPTPEKERECLRTPSSTLLNQSFQVFNENLDNDFEKQDTPDLDSKPSLAGSELPKPPVKRLLDCVDDVSELDTMSAKDSSAAGAGAGTKVPFGLIYPPLLPSSSQPLGSSSISKIRSKMILLNHQSSLLGVNLYAAGLLGPDSEQNPFASAATVASAGSGAGGSAYPLPHVPSSLIRKMASIRNAILPNRPLPCDAADSLGVDAPAQNPSDTSQTSSAAGTNARTTRPTTLKRKKH